MKVVTEELWQRPEFPGMIVVTTNYTTKRNSALVMGRGAALQARERIPGIDVECGKAIIQHFGRTNELNYGFLVIRPENAPGKIGFGIFQVKEHFRDSASLSLIEKSAKRLATWANEHPNVNIRMNFPGIGYGHLSAADVLPLLRVLPDNVLVCRR